MPQNKNAGHGDNGGILTVEEYVKLVEKVRKSSNDVEINRVFDVIVEAMKPRVKNLCRKFRIPGLGEDDIYQEALYAMRYKAIKDYDKTRGSGEGVAAFDRFAMLCIRRHLATELKTSQQVKNQAMIRSVPLVQERNEGDEDLSLINILSHSKGDILDSVERKEYYSKLVSKLLGKLSGFEKEVFMLYVERYTYDQIAEIINRRRQSAKTKVNIKGVDNALSRIKNKAESVFDKHGDKGMRVRDATKATDKKKESKRVDDAINRRGVEEE